MTEKSLVMLDEPAGQQTTLKNHVALIVPSHKLQDFVDEMLASQCDDDAAVADALSKVTLAHVASLGSLNLCGSWEGLNGQALGLQEPMGSSEHVTLFVGEFVGDLACAIAVLKASFLRQPGFSEGGNPGGVLPAVFTRQSDKTKTGIVPPSAPIIFYILNTSS